jgi:hypothetical protein
MHISALPFNLHAALYIIQYSLPSHEHRSRPICSVHDDFSLVNSDILLFLEHEPPPLTKTFLGTTSQLPTQSTALGPFLSVDFSGSGLSEILLARPS